MASRITRSLQNCFFILCLYAALAAFMNEGFKQAHERKAVKAAMAIAAPVAPQLAESVIAGVDQDRSPIIVDKPADPVEDKLKTVYAELIKEDQPQLTDKQAQDIAQAYREEEVVNNLPHGLVLSIGHVESWHDPKAHSNKDAFGLMQIQFPTGKDFAKKLELWEEPMPKELPAKASAKEKKAAQKAFVAKQKKADKELVEKLCEPKSNIKIGSKVLATYIDWEGSIPKALKKYSGDATGYSQKVDNFRQIVLARLQD